MENQPETPPPAPIAPLMPPPMPPVWPGPPEPKRSGSAGLIAAVTVFALVLIGCLGSVGYNVRNMGAGSGAHGAAPRFPFLPTQGASAPSETGDDNSTGPEASTYPVADVDDLSQVCDGDTYYPQSPKYQGKAPHPLAIMLKDRKDLSSRIQHPIYGVPYSSAKSRESAWNPRTTPTKVQLVACVDLVSSGPKLKTCKFDDPKPDTLPLKRGFYQLALYDVATHRQLLSKRLTGDDRVCPSFVLLGSDRTLYTGVSDRQFIQTLKPFVEK